ncbi:MAG TPA: 2,3-diaminopropionate biosynthesis protein SbnA [Thermoanaerobaculia bacterium]|nr:2,3-diaminopropionate biosynthesis protein SbnA [Thermoanaerobaculia bacterium]
MEESIYDHNTELIRENILDVVGKTPLVQLKRYLPDSNCRLLVKLEALNPGGSIKDRPAMEILKRALASGTINTGTVIIESSSGNMGIGLAQACRFYGLRFICVVDSRTAAQNIQLLKAYGAEVEHVSEPDPETGEFLKARINRVRVLLREIRNSFWPNQYENLANPGAHYRATMREIAHALAGKVDYLFVATSTCGTIRGCAEYARDYGMRTRIVAVDAIGSLIFSDIKGKRMIPGLGAGLKPPLFEGALIDECVHVSDLDCVVGCRRLLMHEAILAGGSSGGVLAAVEKVRHLLPDDATCVAILPDRGERYLDTIYSDDWVRHHFGEVDHLWGQTASISLETMLAQERHI